MAFDLQGRGLSRWWYWSPPDCSLIARCWLLVGRPSGGLGESVGPRGPPRGIGSGGRAARAGFDFVLGFEAKVEVQVEVKVKVEVQVDFEFDFASEGSTFGSDEPGLEASLGAPREVVRTPLAFGRAISHKRPGGQQPLRTQDPEGFSLPCGPSPVFEFES